jgi:hypothetical protein
MTAERLMLIGGVVAFLLTVYWVRNRKLRERYAVGWLALATMILTVGVFPGLIKNAATAAQLSFPAAVLFVSLGVIYIFAFFVTVSLTRQHRRNVRLLQEVGILRNRLKQLEDGLDGNRVAK